MSEQLIHLTSGESQEDAFATLRAIVGERRLIAGGRKTKGGYRCVCFTEAPPPKFYGVFASNCSGPCFSLDIRCKPWQADPWRCRATTQNE
jgi:hypothetical protein